MNVELLAERGKKSLSQKHAFSSSLSGIQAKEKNTTG